MVNKRLRLVAGCGILLAASAAGAVCPPWYMGATVYNSPANNADSLYGVCAHPSDGSIVVAGSENRTDLGTGKDWRVTSYDSMGAVQWTRSVDGANGGAVDEAFGVAIGSWGNCAVAGYMTNPASGEDWLVMSYSPTGADRWQYFYTQGPASATERATAVAIDSNSDVIAAGYQCQSKCAWRVEKISGAGGTMVWSRSGVTTGGVSGRANAVAIGPGDDVIVVGSEAGTGTATVAFVRRFNSSGGDLWGRTIDVPGSTVDEATGVAVDAAGNVYVAIRANPTGLIRKYDSAGNLAGEWHFRVPTFTGDGLPAAMTIDAAGLPVAAGVSSTASSEPLTVKYDTVGTPLWLIRGGGDPVKAVAAGPGGVLTVAGERLDPSPPFSLDWSFYRVTEPATCQGSDLVVSAATSPAHPRPGDVVTCTSTVTTSRTWSGMGMSPYYRLVSGADLVSNAAGPVPDLFTGGWVTGVSQVTFTAVHTGSVQLVFGAERNETWGFSSPVYIASFGSEVTATVRVMSDIELAGAIPPKDNQLQVRQVVVDPQRGTRAYITARASGRPGGEVTLAVFTVAGVPVGDLAAIRLDGSGAGAIEFDGTIAGKTLRPGVYWIVAGGALSDRRKIVIAGGSK